MEMLTTFGPFDNGDIINETYLSHVYLLSLLFDKWVSYTNAYAKHNILFHKFKPVKIIISSDLLQFIITWDLSNYQQRRTTGNKKVIGQPILSQMACHKTASTTYGKAFMSPMLTTMTTTTIHQKMMMAMIKLMIFGHVR